MEPEAKYTKFFAAESVDGVFYGEYHYFSKKMRDMDMQMFIYPNVDITHWGYKAFDGNFDKHLRECKERAEKPAPEVAAATQALQ